MNVPCKCGQKSPVQDGEIIVCDNCNGFIRNASCMSQRRPMSSGRCLQPKLSQRVKDLWCWDGVTGPSVEASSLQCISDKAERNTLPDGTLMTKTHIQYHRDQEGELTHWTHSMSNGQTATIWND